MMRGRGLSFQSDVVYGHLSRTPGKQRWKHHWTNTTSVSVTISISVNVSKKWESQPNKSYDGLPPSWAGLLCSPDCLSYLVFQIYWMSFNSWHRDGSPLPLGLWTCSLLCLETLCPLPISPSTGLLLLTFNLGSFSDVKASLTLRH